MKKLSKIEIIAGILGSFLLLFFIFFYVCMFNIFLPSKAVTIAIEKELASIKARGEPVSLEELAPSLIPDEENAAFIYKEVFEKIGKVPAELRDLLSKYPAELTWEEKISLKTFLDERSEAFSLLEKALTYEKCHFPIDYSESPIPELSHLDHIRNCGRFLALQSLWEISAGNTDNATNNSLKIMELSKTISEEPFIISQLVNIAIGGVAVNSLEKILSEGSISPETLERIINALKNYEINIRGGVKLGLIGERCIFIGAFENPDNFWFGEVNSDVNREKIKRFLKSGFFKNDELYGIKMYGKLISFCELPVPQAITESKKLREEAEDNLEFKPWKLKDLNILSRIMLPVMDRIFLQWARYTAKLRQAIIVCALEFYQMKYGIYPEHIFDIPSDIVSVLPKDPFTGEDFIYRRENNSFILYSVGENLKDDGGVSCIEGENGKKADIVWGESEHCK